VPKPLALRSPAATPAAISPNGDGIHDAATVSYTLTAAATVTAALRTPEGQQLATLFSARRKAGKNTFTFSADAVADGRYDIVLTATDGRTTVAATVPITVDRTVGALAVSPPVISPNGDRRNDALSVSFELARAALLRLDVKRGAKLVAPIFAGDLGIGPESFTWPGTAGGRRAPDGSYDAALVTTSDLGTTSYDLPFRIDTVPPVLRALSFRRLVFRISEPARVRLLVDGHAYIRSVRAGVFSLRLGRVPRRVTVSAIDPAGNVSRTLRYSAASRTFAPKRS
jgi:hypothetical protein